MTSETRTPAQQHIDHLYSLGFDLGTHDVAVLNRTEEVAASVAALAETVAEQEQTLDDWTHLVHARLETHSQRMSQSNAMLVKAVTELCDLVDWLAVGTVHMIGVDACSQINERTAALRALESPASAPEPDPLCQCGHPKSEHFNRKPLVCCKWDYCCCEEFVPQASPATAHQEPPEPVCQNCEHPLSDHGRFSKGAWCEHLLVRVTHAEGVMCECEQFVPQASPPCATCGGMGNQYEEGLLHSMRIIPCPDCNGGGVTRTPVTCAGCRWYEADSDGDMYCWSLGIFSEPDWGCLSWTAKEGTDGR